ncbi:MBL fold metallo-hydrolase RNA specificity domain-containing protein [Chryseolinea lacunae]|uniref:MBL fold metallo-hydrolase n=1 Tax=Chryseolinea lacunae TaxID=2801331 RepID=A0ABS1KSI4_9BACT|nr:MBL fold metallo-hydrolase [Chryseolinea lacunae]MBL0742310.1 MBL fold metallo-hydrolase [Chryseolinea lacunae]
MDVKAKFLGGAKSVTGSRHLIDIGGTYILLDCGLFQGLKELRLRNWDHFPVDPKKIHAVVISHAHIDHTGYLPKLVKDGYDGPIYCTPPTADLMQIMLLDSARLQHEEANYARKKGYSKHAEPTGLYDEDDAKKTFTLFKTFDYKQKFRIHDRVEVVYQDAGHLLGSAITEIFIQGDTQTKKIVFSGDLGRYQQAMLRPPESIAQADVLFVESTYGTKDSPYEDPEVELTRVVNEAFARGGVLIIPAFAVGRTQGLLYYFRKLMKDDKIPDVPVYIDSPMAISTTYLFYKHPNYHKVESSRDELAHALETNMLVFVKSPEHSKSLNELRSNAIIISSSGMMTGGRILHHMFNRLRNPQDTFLIAGYQAEGTRGRNLQDNAQTIRIFGEDVPVRCKIEHISSMSGHADRAELFTWMRGFTEKPKLTLCVHGEGEAQEQYAQAIRDTLHWNVTVPKYLQEIELFKGI